MIGLRSNEKIYLTKRRHKIVLITQLFLGILFFLLIGFLMAGTFFSSFSSLSDWLSRFFPLLSGLNLRYLFLFFLSLFFPIFWQIIFLVVADYYLDCWIVTNERIISTESLGLFNRTESSIPLDKIQDVTFEIRGVLPALYNFGDLQIQTAGEFRKFFFHQIPDPEGTKEVIFQAQREFLKSLKSG